MSAACRAQNPEYFEFLNTSWEGKPPHLDLLIGNTAVREGLENDIPVDEITRNWHKITADFDQQRKPFLLYD